MQHMQIFDDVYLDDMDQLAARYRVPRLDAMDPVAMVEMMNTNLADSPGK